MILLFSLFILINASDTIVVRYENLSELAEKFSPTYKEIKFNKNASALGFAANIASAIGNAEFSINKNEITYQKPPAPILSPQYGSTLSLSTSILATNNLFRAVGSYLDFKNSILSQEDAKLQFLLNLKTLYLNTVKLKKTVEAYGKALERSKLYYELIVERYKLGMVSKTDSLKGEIEIKNAEINLLNAQNAYQKSLEQLKSLLGLKDDSFIILADYEPSLDSFQVRERGFYIENALKNNLTVKTLSAIMNSSRVNLLYSTLSFVPQISFGKTWYYSGKDLPKSLEDYSEKEQWTIQAYINLVNYPFAVAQKSQLERAYTYRYKKTILDITAKVKSAYEDLLYNAKTFELARLRLEQAKAAYSLASEQYKEGLISLLQLMDAETSYLQSEVGLIEAKYNYLIAIENLSYLTGMEVGK